jgi:flagellar basal-body rod modification protein FlgD
METTTTLAQTSANIARKAPTEVTKSKNDLSGDFSTFLTLLTAQLRNQDPLKPVQSTEFVAQLASFSAVEQQVQSNSKLESILEAVASGATGGLSQWIGQEVRNPGSATYENKPLDVQYLSHTDADRVELVVYNENNEIVARQDVNKNESNLQWSGILADGTRAVAGAGYRFETNSMLNGEVIANTPALVFSTVQEVRKFQGEPVLYFADGTQMRAADVEAIRAPQA